MPRRLSIAIALALVPTGCTLHSGAASKPAPVQTRPAVIGSPLDLRTRDELSLLGQLLDRRDVLRARLVAERLVGRIPANDPVFADHLAELDHQLTEQDVEVGNGFLWAHKPIMDESQWGAADGRAKTFLKSRTSPVWSTGVSILRIRMEDPEREKCFTVATDRLVHFSLRDGGSGMGGYLPLHSGEFLLVARPWMPNPISGGISIRSLCHADPTVDMSVPATGVVHAGELLVRAVSREKTGGILVRVVPEEGLALSGARVHIGRIVASYDCSHPLQADGTSRLDGLAAGPCHLYVESGENFRGLPLRAEILAGTTTEIPMKVFAPRCVTVDWKYRQPSGQGEWQQGSSAVLTGRWGLSNVPGVNRDLFRLTDWDGTGAKIRASTGYMQPVDPADFDVPQVSASKEELRAGDSREFPVEIGKVFALRFGYPNRGGEGEALLRIRGIESSLSSTSCTNPVRPSTPFSRYDCLSLVRWWPSPTPLSPLRPRESPLSLIRPAVMEQRGSYGCSTASSAPVTAAVESPSHGSESPPAEKRTPTGREVTSWPAGADPGHEMRRRDDLRLLGQLLDRHEVLRAWVLAEQLRGQVPADHAMLKKHLAELNRQMVDHKVEIGKGYLWAHKPAADDSHWADVISGTLDRLERFGRSRSATGVAILRLSFERPDWERTTAVSCGRLVVLNTRDAGYGMGSTDAADNEFILFARAFGSDDPAGHLEIKALRHASPRLDFTIPASGVECLGDLMLLAALNPGLGELAVRVVREPGLPPANALLYVGRDWPSGKGGYPVKEDDTCVLSGLVPGPCRLSVMAGDHYRTIEQRVEIKAGEVTAVELKAYAPRKVVVDWKYRLPSGEGQWHEGSCTVLTGRSPPRDLWGCRCNTFHLRDWNGSEALISSNNGGLTPIDVADYEVPRVRASLQELRSNGQPGSRMIMIRSFPIAVGRTFAMRYGYAGQGGEGEAVMRIRSIESTIPLASQPAK